MRRQHFFAVLSGLVAIALVASDASATYHPTLGRWLQRDPIEYADGMSLYECVGSSPVTDRDPYGLFRGGDWTGGAMSRGGSSSWSEAWDRFQMERGWRYKEFTYATDVMEQWAEGKGGTYTGSDKMRADLAASSEIKGKIKDLIEPDIMTAGSALPCWNTEEAATSLAFGTDAKDKIVLTGELAATALTPDRVTCQVNMAYYKRCDPLASCCPSIPYIAFASCRLQDRYDYHNPRDENGNMREQYKTADWQKRWGLDVAWSHQQRLKRHGKHEYVDIDVAFQVDLDGELCVP